MAVDRSFVKSLPKAELHAHLSGSISKESLHAIWSDKRLKQKCLDLEDPLTAMRADGDFVDITSFFPLFNRYIYNLVDDEPSIIYATHGVISDFAADGVVYLELRTTPRENAASGLTMARYVEVVNDLLKKHHESQNESANPKSLSNIEVYLILSIDRKMTAEQAMDVVDLAIQYRHDSLSNPANELRKGDGYVVGVDLCGNPIKGDVAVFTAAFQKAKMYHLGLTVHFAEVPQSGTDRELESVLSWRPDRLGHVIHVPTKIKERIAERKLALELCLSCNVLAKLTTGGYAAHHFAEWRRVDCPIALSASVIAISAMLRCYPLTSAQTDDVGIFNSPLSNEYFLAAQHFQLDRRELLKLSKNTATAVFGNNKRLIRLLDEFEKDWRLE